MVSLEKWFCCNVPLPEIVFDNNGQDFFIIRDIPIAFHEGVKINREAMICKRCYSVWFIRNSHLYKLGKVKIDFSPFHIKLPVLLTNVLGKSCYYNFKTGEFNKFKHPDFLTSFRENKRKLSFLQKKRKEIATAIRLEEFEKIRKKAEKDKSKPCEELFESLWIKLINEENDEQKNCKSE